VIVLLIRWYLLIFTIRKTKLNKDIIFFEFEKDFTNSNLLHFFDYFFLLLSSVSFLDEYRLNKSHIFNIKNNTLNNNNIYKLNNLNGSVNLIYQTHLYGLVSF